MGRWTYAPPEALRIGAITAAVVAFVFWSRPTAAVVIWIVVALLIVLGLIELIGRATARASSASSLTAPREHERTH